MKLPMIVAHRGASADAPENTMAAFRLGFAHDADAIEGDFHLTADGRLACLHDDDFRATAGVDRTVASMTSDEIRMLRVGFRKRPETWTEPVPMLEEVLALVPQGKRVFIEIKGADAAIPELKRVIEASKKVCEQLSVISFDAGSIAASKKAMPQVKAFWLAGFPRDKPTEWLSADAVAEKAKAIGADGVDLEGNPVALTPSFVDTLRAARLEWHVWTIDDPERAKHFAAMGVDSITTNKPQAIRAALVG